MPVSFVQSIWCQHVVFFKLRELIVNHAKLPHAWNDQNIVQFSFITTATKLNKIVYFGVQVDFILLEWSYGYNINIVVIKS